MGDMSGGICSMINHNLSQQYFDSNNGDVSSGNSFINSHTLSQCDDLSKFKDMDRYVEKVDVSIGCFSMNINNFYQLNGLKSFMNFNDRDDMETNANLHNGYVTSVIGLINSHTLPQCN